MSEPLLAVSENLDDGTRPPSLPASVPNLVPQDPSPPLQAVLDSLDNEIPTQQSPRSPLFSLSSPSPPAPPAPCASSSVTSAEVAAPANPAPCMRKYIFNNKIKDPDLSDLLFLEQNLGNRNAIAQSLSLELLFGPFPYVPYDVESDISQLLNLGLSHLELVAATMRVAARNWLQAMFSLDKEKGKELFTLVKTVWLNSRTRSTLLKWDNPTFISVGRLFAYICIDMEDWEEARGTLLALREWMRGEPHTFFELQLELSWILNANNRFREEESALHSIIDNLERMRKYDRIQALELKDSPFLDRVRYRLAYCFAMQENLGSALEELAQADSDEGLQEMTHELVFATSLLRELDLRWLLFNGLTEIEVRENAQLILARMVLLFGYLPRSPGSPAFDNYDNFIGRDRELLGKLYTYTVGSRECVLDLDAPCPRLKAAFRGSNYYEVSESDLGRLISYSPDIRVTVTTMVTLVKLYYISGRTGKCLEMARIVDRTVSDAVSQPELVPFRLSALQWYQRAKWRLANLTNAQQVFQASADFREPLDPLVFLRYKHGSSKCEYSWFEKHRVLQLENSEERLRTKGVLLPHYASTYGPLCFTYKDSMTRTDLFPHWAVDLFNEDLGNHREVRNFMSWAMRRPPYYSWHYTDKSLDRHLVSTFIPARHQVDWAESRGSLSTFHCHEFPIMDIAKFEQTWAESYAGQHISTFKSSNYISTVSMLRVVETGRRERRLMKRHHSYSSSDSVPKLMLRTKCCLTTHTLPTFCFTTVQLINNHFKQLTIKWRDAVNGSKTILQMMNVEILSLKGTNTTVISKILHFAQDLTDMEAMLETQILDLEQYRRNLEPSSTLLEEVKLWEADYEVPEGYLLHELQKIEEEMHRLLEFISGDLTRKVESLIQKEFNLVSIHEAQTSVRLGLSMQRLSWITFIFLPLIFVSSLFGMNVDILQTDGHKPSWWWYIIFSLIATILVSGGWAAFKYMDVNIPPFSIFTFWKNRRPKRVQRNFTWSIRDDIEASDFDIRRRETTASGVENYKAQGTWESGTVVEEESSRRRVTGSRT